MYDSKVIRSSSQESEWISSQDSTSAIGIALFDDDTVVKLERTRCYGWCPAYEVSLFGSGRVVFHGRAFVCEQAPADRFVDRTTIAKLVNGLTVAGFQGMPNFLNEDATDAHTARITLKRGDVQHTVEHYHGDMAAPRLLDWIENCIDEVANTSMWLGHRQGTETVCVRRDGSTRSVEEMNFDLSGRGDR